MRSKCRNCTSGRKSVAGNGFIDIDFLYDVERLAVRRCFCLFWRFVIAHAQFRQYYYTSSLKSEIILARQY